MELVYYKDSRGNFGDDLNPEFFSAVCENYKKINKDKLIGIGTLLNQSRGVINSSIIFGSGFGQGLPPIVDYSSTDILGVRGPLTAKALGIDPDEYVIGDPALYLPEIDRFNGAESLSRARYVVGLHHRTAELWNFPDGMVEDFFFLDPAEELLERYIATIRDADIVFAESMHSAIVAAAYGVPFLRIDLLGKGDATKWLDFYQSIGMDNKLFTHSLSFLRAPLLRRLELFLAKKGTIDLNRAFERATIIPERHLGMLTDELKVIAAYAINPQIFRKNVKALRGRISIAVERLAMMAEDI